MVDPHSTAVCCMCGDVGFSDKLFRCHNCRDRIQHSYCSNYYGQSAEPIELCDWCRRDQERSAAATPSRHGGGSSKKIQYSGGGVTSRSEYAAGAKKVMLDHHHHYQNSRREEGEGEGANKGKSGGGGAPSPRGTTRRYKLLKDVMC